MAVTVVLRSDEGGQQELPGVDLAPLVANAAFVAHLIAWQQGGRQDAAAADVEEVSLPTGPCPVELAVQVVEWFCKQHSPTIDGNAGGSAAALPGGEDSAEPAAAGRQRQEQAPQDATLSSPTPATGAPSPADEPPGPHVSSFAPGAPARSACSGSARPTHPPALQAAGGSSNTTIRRPSSAQGPARPGSAPRGAPGTSPVPTAQRTPPAAARSTAPAVPPLTPARGSTSAPGAASDPRPSQAGASAGPSTPRQAQRPSSFAGAGSRTSSARPAGPASRTASAATPAGRAARAAPAPPGAAQSSAARPASATRQPPARQYQQQQQPRAAAPAAPSTPSSASSSRSAVAIARLHAGLPSSTAKADPTPPPAAPAPAAPPPPDFVRPSTVGVLLHLADLWQSDSLKRALVDALATAPAFCAGLRRPTAGTAALQQVPQVLALLRGALGSVGDADGSLARLAGRCEAWLAEHAQHAWPTRVFAALDAAQQEAVLQRALAKLQPTSGLLALRLLRASQQVHAALPAGLGWTRGVEALALRLRQGVLEHVWAHVDTLLLGSQDVLAELSSPWHADSLALIEEHAERAAAAAPGSALRLLAFDVGPLLLQLQEGDDTERAQRVQDVLQALRQRVARQAVRGVGRLHRSPEWAARTAQQRQLANELITSVMRPDEVALFDSARR